MSVRYRQHNTFLPCGCFLHEWLPYPDISCTRIGSELHVCGITTNGILWHTYRRSDTSWSSFVNVFSPIVPCTRVSTAEVNGELHVCVISGGNVLHSIRHILGNWDNFGNVESTEAGNITSDFRDIGCESINSELNLACVTNDGKIWHTIRYTNTSWQKFGDVKSQAGNPGTFLNVDLANINNNLHLCGITNNGKLWHTIRNSNDGIWQNPFGDVETQTGTKGPYRDISCTGNIVQLQLIVVDSNG